MGTVLEIQDGITRSEVLEVARCAARSISLVPKWTDITPPVRLALNLLKDAKPQLGHGIIWRGRLPWVGLDVLSCLADDARSRRDGAFLFPGKYHRWAEAGDFGKEFSTSSELGNFISSLLDMPLIPTSSTYNYYDEAGQSAYPHVDVDHAPVNALIMLKHEFQGAASSRLVVYPCESDPIPIDLAVGEVIVFWGGTTVHERLAVGTGETVWIMGAGFNIS